MTSLVDTVINRAQRNKYARWYKCLIASRLERLETVERAELHHIAPVSVFPEYELESDNLIRLTLREHYIAHLILMRMFEGEDRKKMILAAFMMGSRVHATSRCYSRLRSEFALKMKMNNPMKKKEASDKVARTLKGRTKDTHEYIRRASEKKSQCTINNSMWLKISREKFRATVNSMTDDERRKLFSHECSMEQREKFRKERTGKTKENCARVLKMSQTKLKRAACLTADERKARFSTTTGWRWYHDDKKMISALMNPKDVVLDCEWKLGRKRYENKKN